MAALHLQHDKQTETENARRLISDSGYDILYEWIAIIKISRADTRAGEQVVIRMGQIKWAIRTTQSLVRGSGIGLLI